MTPIEDFNPHLTDADIEEFIKLYKQEFRKKITPDEAREMATRVMTLYNLLYLEAPRESAPTARVIENRSNPAPESAPRAAKKVRIPTHPSPRLDDIRKSKGP